MCGVQDPRSQRLYDASARESKYLPYFVTSCLFYHLVQYFTPSRTCSPGTCLVSQASSGRWNVVSRRPTTVVFFFNGRKLLLRCILPWIYAISQHHTFYPYFAVFSRTLFSGVVSLPHTCSLQFLGGRRLRSDCTSPCRGRCLLVGY